MVKDLKHTKGGAVSLPEGQPTLRIVATQPNANPKGDIFGGWLMSQIDIAASIIAVQRARGPVTTVAVNTLQFVAPIFVGDRVSFYASLVTVGKTSLRIHIEVFAERFGRSYTQTVKVSDSTLTFVAITAPGKKRLVPK
ncbi:MAG: acyl-CoA thioesterase [Gammaproteobacteria bacterium]|nr:acyl-CoA thioesterase [Gammaproteobacteria bacterium]